MHIRLSQRTGITNNIIETSTQTIAYIGNNYLNKNKIATAIVNATTLPLTDNYLWIPETTDNAVAGLDSLITYLQPKYATINALQNAINNVNNTANHEISNMQTETDNIDITNQQNVNKYVNYHTNHADFMYQGILLKTTTV